MVAQGLSGGAVLLLSALGLTIIYGVMGVVNLAHGEFVMLGSYTMVLLSPSLTSWAAILAAPVLVGAVGLLADRILVRWLYQDPIASMLATFGLAMIVRQIVVIAEGPQLRYVPLPVTATITIGPLHGFPGWRAVLIVAAAAATAVVGVWLSRTSSGLKLRTATADRDMAAALGTDVSRVNAVAFAVGAALAGLAGALVAPLGSVHPHMGTAYLVGAFLVVILAGLASVRGAALWATGVGVATAVLATHLDDVIAQLVVWAAALVLVASRRQALVPDRV